jgi:hypothetical protein
MKTTIQPFIPVIRCILVLYGCSPAHTSKTQKGIDQQPVLVAEKVSTIDTWAPKMVSGTSRYLVIDSSTISTNGDSSHSSSIATTAIYNLTLATVADSLSLSVRVESLTTNSQVQIAKHSLHTDSIENFRATVSSNGRFSPITGVLRSLCVVGVNPVATRIWELTINYPHQQLKVGDEWTDTISTTSCRGKMTLQQQNIYRYKIIDFSLQKGSDLAQIQRAVSTTFHSISTNSGNELTTTGTGSSSSVLYINRKTAMLVQSSEHSQVALTVNTTRGSYPFTQNTSTQIALH